LSATNQKANKINYRTAKEKQTKAGQTHLWVAKRQLIALRM